MPSCLLSRCNIDANSHEMPSISACAVLAQGHLMATQDPSAMLIQWVTKNSVNPNVKWGASSGQYTGSNAVSAAFLGVSPDSSGVVAYL